MFIFNLMIKTSKRLFQSLARNHRKSKWLPSKSNSDSHRLMGLDNKTATKKIKSLYTNKPKEELIGNHQTVNEALLIYNAVTEQRNHFVINTILKVFIKCGAHRRVQSLWNDIIHIDGVSLPLAFKCAVGMVTQSETVDIDSVDVGMRVSVEVLELLRDRRYEMNEFERKDFSVSSSSLISHCRSHSELQSVHQMVSAVSLWQRESVDIFISTALMMAYSKWGAVDEAKCAFYGVPESERDIPSINAMLTVLVNGERFEESMSFYDEWRGRAGADGNGRNDVFDLLALRVCIGDMERNGLKAKGFEFGTRINGDIEWRERAAMSVNGANGRISGMDIDSIPILQRRSKALVHCQMDFYGECGAIESMWTLLEALPMMERDAVSIGTMMKGLIRNGDSASALELHSKYENVSNDTADLLALKCCSILEGPKEIEYGNALCFKLDAKRNSVNLLNAAIAFKGFQGDIASAKQLFDRMDGDKKDIVTLNSMMTALNHNGHFEESLALYDEYGHLVTRSASCSQSAGRWTSGREDVAHILAIGACCNLKDLERGKAIHCELKQSHFGRHALSQFVNVGNSLIDFYGMNGDIESAQRVFAEMDWRVHSVSTLNSMMKMYVESGHCAKALALYDNNDDGNRVERDAVSHFTAIRACIECRDYERGNRICDEMKRATVRFDDDLLLKTTMIDFYGFFGRIDAAKIVFDAIVDEQRLNTVALNSMLKNLVLNDLHSEAMALYEEHRDSGLMDDISKCIAISICTETEDQEKGQRILEDIVGNRASNELSVEVQNSLIKFHGAFGELERARMIYNDLADRRLLDTVNVNTMMEALSVNEAHSECIEMAFELIEGRINRLEPDPISFVTALKAATRCSALHRGLEIHDVLKRDFPSFLDEESVAVHLINFYGKCSMTTMAEAVFTRFIDRNPTGCSLDIWHSVIRAFGRNGDYQNTLRLFRRLTEMESMEMNDRTFIVIINALSHCGHIAEAEDLWRTQIADDAVKWNCFVVSAVVDGFARNGQLIDGKRIIDEYTEGQKGPHHSAMWISLLNGCKLFGDKQLADSLYNEMLNISDFDGHHLTAASVLMSNLHANV